MDLRVSVAFHTGAGEKRAALLICFGELELNGLGVFSGHSWERCIFFYC